MIQSEDPLLPPGEYPIWSPYDSFEAAAALMAALMADQSDEALPPDTLEPVCPSSPPSSPPSRRRS